MTRTIISSLAVSSLLLACAFLAGAPVAAQQQTWTGMISDSQCGGNHGSEVDVKECTLKCIREGFKYVLATDNGTHVVPIANQDFAALQTFAGDTVKVTGDVKDGAIVIAKIELE